MRLIRLTATTRRAIVAIAVAALGTSTPAATEAAERGDAQVGSLVEAARPHVLDGDLAAVVLRVRGALVCSGIPITGTSLVVTAAHCVLDPAGNVTAVTVVRDGIERSPREVLVNRRYHETPRPDLDAAVLVMEQAVPGPSATLGEPVPTAGFVTLVGFQPLDTDGTLLRGTSYHDRPMPKGVTGGVIGIESRPTGCVHPASSIDISATQLTAPCGLIQGASGGGLFGEQDGRLVLHGIISNVDLELSSNGLTPMAAVKELLDHRDEYSHAVSEVRGEPSRRSTIS